VDQNGYFYHEWGEGEHVNAKEVEVELRAQIERALAMGVRPAHLDSHLVQRVGAEASQIRYTREHTVQLCHAIGQMFHWSYLPVRTCSGL
jgi:predicted glycoside hydrolase/deacetylase ChbG (UPF0249 family)